MKTKEHVEDGVRFRWAGALIVVQPAEAPLSEVPADMIELPEWVNVSKMDDDCFKTLCRRWLWSHSAANRFPAPTGQQPLTFAFVKGPPR